MVFSTMLCMLLAINVIEINGTVHQRKLFKQLFENYRKETRPYDFANPRPVNVTVQLFIKQIQKIVESDQTVKLYCWMELYWKDDFLVWNPRHFHGVSEIVVPSNKIWQPDLLVYNNAQMNHKSEIETNAVIKHDGSVTVYKALITSLTCEFKMDAFPLDQHICFMKLSSWSYDGGGIMLDTLVPASVDNNKSLHDISVLHHYMPSSEWTLTDFKIQKNLKKYECCENPYPDITFYFSIKRHSTYYFFSQLIPSMFICIITIVGSFTPHSSTGEQHEKITLNSTALLSLAIILMMVADKDKMPATSDDLPLLGKFYVGLIVIIFAATVCSAVTLSVQMRGNTNEQVPSTLKKAIKRLWLLRLFFRTDPHGGRKSILCELSRLSSSCKQVEKHSEGDDVDQGLVTALTQLKDTAFLGCQQLNDRRQAKVLQKEWEYIARGLDRVFMTSFAIFTVIYSAGLFWAYNTEVMLISEEFMNMTASHA